MIAAVNVLSLLPSLGEGRPGPDFAALLHGLRAVGAIEIEDFSLGEHVGRAEARGVARIAFDLRRPPFVRGHDSPAAISAQRERGGELQRNAGDEPLRHLDIRHDLFLRLPATGRGQRHAASQQLQRLPAPQTRAAVFRSCLQLHR